MGHLDSEMVHPYDDLADSLHRHLNNLWRRGDITYSTYKEAYRAYKNGTNVVTTTDPTEADMDAYVKDVLKSRLDYSDSELVNLQQARENLERQLESINDQIVSKKNEVTAIRRALDKQEVGA